MEKPARGAQRIPEERKVPEEKLAVGLGSFRPSQETLFSCRRGWPLDLPRSPEDFLPRPQQVRTGNPRIEHRPFLVWNLALESFLLVLSSGVPTPSSSTCKASSGPCPGSKKVLVLI